MSCFRVKYRIEYDSVNDLYRLPKAPELIKIANVVAANVFYTISSDNEPTWVDITALGYDYGGQWFFDVANEKNMFVTSSEVTGDCLEAVNKFINIPTSFISTDVPGSDVPDGFIPDGSETIKLA